MKKCCVVTRHLYGPGGGAQAALAMVRGARALDYEVTVFTIGPLHPENMALLGLEGAGFRAYYEGCSFGYDLLINVDHFSYEPPFARLNAAHIFHPHGPNKLSAFQDNRPPEGYQRFSANSAFTAHWAKEEWGLDMPHLYIPVSPGFYTGRKERRILHVSRFSPPQEMADKGHLQMIRAFQWMCDTNKEDIAAKWELCLAGTVEDQRYFQTLTTAAQGYPITFYTNLTDSELRNLYASAAFYWHATGCTYPRVHGAQEHLGLTTLEAMASGAVPVVLGTGGQLEVVTSEYDGICCQDTQTIGRVTLELIGTPSVWSQLARRAADSAARWQDFPAYIERFRAWLEERPIPDLPPRRDPLLAPLSRYTPADVCVVIPSRDGAGLLKTCLQSLFKTEPEVGQVLVIDNGSTDDTVDVCTAAFAAAGRAADQHSELDVVVCCDPPKSFAESNQMALEFTDKPLLLALNNDIICAEPGWLARLLYNFNDPDVGVAGAKLLFPDGHLQHAGGRLDLNRLDVGYHYRYGEADHPAAWTREMVPFVTGACLLARREVWEWQRLGGGISYEDTDLCLNAALLGYQVVYDPAAVLVHLEGMTRRAVRGDEAQVEAAKRAFLEKWLFILRDEFPRLLRPRD